MQVTVIPIVDGALNNIQRLGKETRTVGDLEKNRDHQNYSIVKNIEKSSEGLKRLVVTQTLVKKIICLRW